ncbi:reverse transcriptase domain-containing protein [Tanacetum coccineum]
MIIEAEIGGHCIHRMYVDGGSASEILYEHCFNRLRPEIKNQLVPATTPLIGFSGEIIWPIGQIQLLVRIGDEEHSASAWMNFVVVRSPSPYNGIIGRPGVRKLQAVPSTAHGMLKLPVEGGVITLKSSRLVPLECALVSGPEETPQAPKPMVEERVKVAINPEYPEQTIMIGSTLTEEGRNKLCNLLQRNLDIFAWKPADMTGVPRHIAEHRLNVREGCSPVRQKKRGQAADRNQAIQEEVGKLVEAGIMKEVHYHDWLSNPVMVKKHDDSWRMCVDFKDLNKACPKDGYPLPEIDWKVESLCGFPFKCFLDAYKGYHQIQMAKEDEEKTAFITSQGIFCYTKIPFGLRNAGATYQRLVDKAFHKQIGRNLEVFLAKSTEKSLPFFKILKKCTKKSDFHWTTEAEEAFKQMKQLIAELPMLTAPMKKEELIVYLAAAKETVNAVLMTKREAKQMPIYFVSRALRGSEVNYTSMKKLVLALVHASKRLKRYFQAYPIIIITDQPIQQVLSRPEVTGRLHKWSIELGEYAIHYRPRVSIKGQILADFIVERPEEESPDPLMEVEEELPESWIVFTDGSSYTDSSGEGLILTNPEGMEFTYALRFRFDATNNEVEYEALIAGLRIAKQMGVKNLQANMDSRLVANQVNGTYVAKEADMIRYLEKVRTLTSSFKAKQVLVEELKEKSISKVEILAVVEEEGDTWMTPIFEYLKDEILPANVKKARAVSRKPQWFVVINGILYRKSFLRPWLRCVGPLQANYVLREIHEGLAACTQARDPSWESQILNSSYGLLWIEAKPVATIDGNQIKKFVWDNIVCIFGLPGEIISDNGKQFRDNPFKDWCEKLCIRQHFASVKHPQTNGLVERANRNLGEGIKAILGSRNKKWMEEISRVLWAHRTMIKSSNGDTPFSLTYGTKAVIPAEIGMPTLRTAEVDLVQNNEALEINLDLLEERREQAAIHEAKSKARMEKYYNSKVKNTSFKPGDLVYRNNNASRTEDTGKLGPKWEGPYEVTEALGKGAYKLRDRDGKKLQRTWNVSNLKKCYIHKM